MIEVKSCASASGSAVLNQKLSQERDQQRHPTSGTAGAYPADEYAGTRGDG